MKWTFLTTFFTKRKPVVAFAYPIIEPVVKSTSCGCDVEKYSVFVFDGGKYEEGVPMNLCTKHIKEACYCGKLVEFL